MSTEGFTRVPRQELNFVKKQLRVVINKLKQRRIDLNLTQEGLAERLDLACGSVQRIEQGVRAPGIGTLIRLCTALGMELEVKEVKQLNELKNNRRRTIRRAKKI